MRQSIKNRYDWVKLRRRRRGRRGSNWFERTRPAPGAVAIPNPPFPCALSLQPVPFPFSSRIILSSASLPPRLSTQLFHAFWRVVIIINTLLLLFRFLRRLSFRTICFVSFCKLLVHLADNDQLMSIMSLSLHSASSDTVSLTSRHTITSHKHWAAIFDERIYQICNIVHPGLPIDFDAVEHIRFFLQSIVSEVSLYSSQN